MSKASEAKFVLATWLMDMSCQASKNLLQSKIATSPVPEHFSLECIFAEVDSCVSQVLSVLDPISSGTEGSLISSHVLRKKLLKSELPLHDNHRSQLPDLIYQEFQFLLLHLSSGDYLNARNRFLHFVMSLPLISLEKKQSTACKEIDAMDKHGKWYQAFLISSGPKSSLVHFMVRLCLHPLIYICSICLNPNLQ